MEIDKKNLQFFVGAAVIGKGGDVLWKTYGAVDNDLGFKCIAPIPPSTIPTENILLFSLAKGKIAKMQGGDPTAVAIDASGYEYHVLCSAIIEMGKDWFPPIDEAATAEYNKIMEDMTKQKIDKLKQQSQPGVEPNPGTQSKPVPQPKAKPKKTVN